MSLGTCTAERLRLLLRDQGDAPLFTQMDLDALLEETASTEEAVALGWLLKAGSASAASDQSVTTRQIGQVMTTYGRLGTASETFTQAMAMHQYWMRRAGLSRGARARWMQIKPGAGTLVGNLTALYDRLEGYAVQGDFSTLYL